MPTFSLHEAIRYAVTAALVAVCVYLMVPVSKLENLKGMRDTISDGGLAVLMFAAGALAFNAYRQLIYNLGLRMFFDWARSCKCVRQCVGSGPRNFLRVKLDVSSRSEWFRASEVWAFCSIKWLEKESAPMRVWGAGVHAFYFSMVASIVAGAFAAGDSSLGECRHYAYAVALCSFLLGLITDVFHEQAETLLAAGVWRDHQSEIRTVWANSNAADIASRST